MPTDSTWEPTAGIVGPHVSRLGVSRYLEAIVVDKYFSSAQERYLTACGRSCGAVDGFKLKRDLFNPDKLTSLKQPLLLLGGSPANYVPYYRTVGTGVLTPATYDDRPTPRSSVVYANAMLSVGELSFVLRKVIGGHRELLPERMV